MTAERWRDDQLVALAAEWITEREAFLASMQTYFASHLPPGTAAPQSPLDPAAYQAELAAIGQRLAQFLRTMEGAVWYVLQQRLPAYERDLDLQFAAVFRQDATRLATLLPPSEATALHTALRQAVALGQHILRLYHDLQGHFDFNVVRFARRLASHMQYLLYPVRHHIPALRTYWLLAQADPALCDPPLCDVHPAAGIQRYEMDGQRSAYTAYIPEYYRPDRTWPLLLTLHGGSGNDADFLWTWLKYAKSHGYLLVSAKSFGPTWYAWDAPSLFHILDDMQARYRVDTKRILLNGLSDGGSFGYEVGFAFPERFAGLAVVAGILRPHQRAPQAAQLPVYIAHGAQDQLFPVAYIRMVAAKLQELGHDVTYHEIADFGHAYPAGENTAILHWFESHTRAQHDA